MNYDEKPWHSFAFRAMLRDTHPRWAIRAQARAVAHSPTREGCMLLTGKAISRQRDIGRITITSFAANRLAPNGYCVRLAAPFLCYADVTLDAHRSPSPVAFTLPPLGMPLEPHTVYLAQTIETIGSDSYAMMLHALPEVSALGIWVQFSAPLGHIGALIPWTLEIAVVHPIILRPEMPIGTVSFWEPEGDIAIYQGRYAGSTGVVASRIAEPVTGEEGVR